MFTSFNSAKVARFGSGATILRSKSEALTDEQIRDAAPSVFASDKHGSRTDRYTYIPTSEVLRGLRGEGFLPFEVRQGGSRDDEKRGFTKHMLRLRHAGDSAVHGDAVRELILLNAHDGTSSYQLMSGAFRIVCCNGLITCDNGQMQRIAHKGDIIGNVIEGAYSIIEQGKENALVIEDMRGLELSRDEQQVFAEAALTLRYNDKDASGEVKAAPVAAESILQARRVDDQGADLWRTFNRVQENLERGGLGYVHRNARGLRSRRETRPVNSIDGNVTLNKALWVLATKMAELKAA